jgi:hypothetical protein
MNKSCPFCGHLLENNDHGLDQNDATLNELYEFVHSGSCTYCRVCNPEIFQEKS